MESSLGFVPKPLSLFFDDAFVNKDKCEKVAMLDDFVQRLNDELRKVKAFKHELPLCMLLLNDAIARLKEEKVKYPRMHDPSLKTNFGGNENESCEKKNWTSSTQLQSTQKIKLGNEDNGRFVHKNSNNGNLCVFEKENSQVSSFDLVPCASELSHGKSMSVCGDISSSSSLLCDEIQNQPQLSQHMQQNQKKQRRCWSLELHCRFVDALQQLGGAQVATPKQIKELMQVDGLTNDEVKNHLQVSSYESKLMNCLENR